MINIAFVHSVAEIGGAERMSQVLIDGLDKSKFKTMLVCPTDGPFVDAVKSNGIETHILPSEQFSLKESINYVKQQKDWVKFIVENDIGWIHTADPFVTRAILPAVKLTKAKVLTHFHFPFEKSVLQWAYGKMKPDVAVFCSQELQKSTSIFLDEISPSTHQKVIHNGVNVEKFKPIPRKANFVTKIGIVANLQKRKGHDEFIEMAAILDQEGIDAEYWVIGGDILEEPREHHLKKMVEGKGLAEKFIFTGQVNNVKELMNSLDIYICASHQEAFPVSILEAMAMQKIIVSTDVNGIVEALDDSNSYLYKPKKPKEMYDAVLRVFKDKKEAVERSENARRDVVKHFSLDNYISQFEVIYTSFGRS